MGTHTIIMISGAQGSGKTTIMNALKSGFELSGTRVVDLIFADTIYNIHDYAINKLKALGIERDIVKDGKLLQLLGTEWGRNSIDEDIWVKCLLGQVKNCMSVCPDEHVIFLVSDCRFKNEFDGIPEAFTIRLEASRDVRKARCSQWRDNDTHQSEIDLDTYAREGKFHCYIDTEGHKVDTLNNIAAAIVLFGLDKNARGHGYQDVASKYYV